MDASWDFLLTSSRVPWTPHASTRSTVLINEQSWLAKQSAQREPSLHRFRPPRKFPMLHSVSGTTSHFPGTVYGLCLPQVGKMKRKLGPRPSQVVRLNPGQSRSERHPFEGGPKKRESAGEARRRVRKLERFLNPFFSFLRIEIFSLLRIEIFSLLRIECFSLLRQLSWRVKTDCPH